MVGTMDAAGIDGDFLPWDDILHQGPVPTGLSDDELRRTRAAFLAESHRAAFYDSLPFFTARDRALVGADDPLLWFEADLYDQLQLIQILDMLARAGRRARLICIGSFPGRPNFAGLGELTSDELVTLIGTEHEVEEAEFELAQAAWHAFRSPDPTEIERLLASGTSALPFLADALIRHLEEFPAVEDGLSRTERMILESIAGGTRRWSHIFSRLFEIDDRPFLDDWTFRECLENLMTGPTPLLAGHGPFLELWTRLRERKGPLESDLFRAAAADELNLTRAGETVLAGGADAVELNGIDRWFGGVHLEGTAAAWRWSRLKRRLAHAQ